jgi:hypothetical protein
MMITSSVPSPMYMAACYPVGAGVMRELAPSCAKTLFLMVRQCSATEPSPGSSGSPASSQARIPPAIDHAS